jgi:hypothetical protein
MVLVAAFVAVVPPHSSTEEHRRGCRLCATRVQPLDATRQEGVLHPGAAWGWGLDGAHDGQAAAVLDVEDEADRGIRHVGTMVELRVHQSFRDVEGLVFVPAGYHRVRVVVSGLVAPFDGGGVETMRHPTVSLVREDNLAAGQTIGSHAVTSQLTCSASGPRNEVFGTYWNSCSSRVMCGRRRVSSSR